MSASSRHLLVTGAVALWAGVAGCQSPQQAPDFPFPQNPGISDTNGHPRDTLSDYFQLPESITEPPTVEARLATQLRNNFRHLSSELYYFGAPILSNYPPAQPVFRVLRHSASDPVQLFTLQVDERGPFLLVQALNHHSNLGLPQAPPPPPPMLTTSGRQIAPLILSATEQAEKKWLQRPPAIEYTCRYTLSKTQWFNMTNQFPETYSPYYISPSVYEGFDGTTWLFETGTPTSYTLYYCRAAPQSNYLMKWLEAHGYPEQ